MARAEASKRRQRGSFEMLPNGACRVRVYAGTDPVTKREHYLRETVPPGRTERDTLREAEKVRARLVNEVYEHRNPRTNATLTQLIDRHLREARLARKTARTYRDLVDKHVLPFLGKVKVGSIDADSLDSLYAELNRCRDHCSGAKAVDHRMSGEHDCDERCRHHECRPLSASSIRQIHWVLSGAFRRAQRLRWIVSNPMDLAEPPARTPPNPRPPTPEEAARIINAAWADPDWGTLVWFLMVTGLRRGELCAIRWRHLDLVNGVLHLEKSIGQLGSETWEKDAKTHADRRIVLDAETLQLLNEHRSRAEFRAKAAGTDLSDDSFVFSLAPDFSRHLLPDSVTQKYSKMVKRLGLKTSIHKLRHYSATELIAAGVDVRTVAGRLGHAGGGSTTLRTYTAWVSEADQRAAGAIGARMPPRPVHRAAPVFVEIEPASPYEKIAVEIRDRIVDGTFPPGLPIPPVTELARTHEVSVSTVQRAVTMLKDWGLVSATRGKRTLVLQTPAPPSGADTGGRDTGADAPASAEIASQPIPVDLEIRRLGSTVTKLRTYVDPEDPAVLRRLLADAIRRSGTDEAEIRDYELVLRRAGEDAVLMTFVSAV